MQRNARHSLVSSWHRRSPNLNRFL
jgi:hypothetical protein